MGEHDVSLLLLLFALHPLTTQALDLDVEFGDTNVSNDDDDDSVCPSHQSSPPTAPASVHEHSGRKPKTTHERAKTRISSTSSKSADKGKQKAVLRSEMTAEEAQAKREYQSARAAIRKQEKDAIKNDHALVSDTRLLPFDISCSSPINSTVYYRLSIHLHRRGYARYGDRLIDSWSSVYMMSMSLSAV